MPLSEQTLQLLESYLDFLIPKAMTYRDEMKLTVSPERLHHVLPIIYTTDRPHEPILPVKASYSGKWAWRPQLVGSCVPFPYNEDNWYEKIAKLQREELANSLLNDLPISNEEIQRFDLLERLKLYICSYLDNSAQRYLALVIGQGIQQKNKAFQVIVGQLNSRFDPQECIRYAGCFLYNFHLIPPIESVNITPDVEIRMTTFRDIERQVFNIGYSSWDEGDFLPPEYILTVQLDKKPFYERFLNYSYGGDVQPPFVIPKRWRVFCYFPFLI